MSLMKRRTMTMEACAVRDLIRMGNRLLKASGEGEHRSPVLPQKVLKTINP
jgi:hypothetical protein